MKKTKLISSLAALVLTLVCLTFGVYSAVKTTFTASGTITFNAYGLDVVVEGTISGVVANGTEAVKTTFKGATKDQHGDSEVVVGTNGNLPTWEMGDLKFDELNGVIRSFIVIKITNYSSFAITATFGDVTVPTGISSYTNSLNTTYIYAKEYDDVDADTREMAVVLSGESATGSSNTFSVNVNLAPSTLTEDRDASHYNISGGKLFSNADYENKTTSSYAYTGTDVKLIIPQKIGGIKIDGINVGDFMDISSYYYGAEFSENVESFDLLVLPNTIKKVPDLWNNSINCKALSLSNSCEHIGFLAASVSNLCIPSSCSKVNGWYDSEMAVQELVVLSEKTVFGWYVYSDESDKPGKGVYNFSKCYFNGKLNDFIIYSDLNCGFANPLDIKNLYSLDYTNSYVVKNQNV